MVRVTHDVDTIGEATLEAQPKPRVHRWVEDVSQRWRTEVPDIARGLELGVDELRRPADTQPRFCHVEPEDRPAMPHSKAVAR